MLWPASSAPAAQATLRAGVFAGVRTPGPHRQVSLPRAGAMGSMGRMAAPDSRSSRVWLPIAVLAAAQFVMVLDSSVMNVSISQIVKDLNTSIQGVQLAITAYTLVMAALMLAGAKL